MRGGHWSRRAASTSPGTCSRIQEPARRDEHNTSGLEPFLGQGRTKIEEKQKMLTKREAPTKARVCSGTWQGSRAAGKPGSCRTGAGIWQQPHPELLPGLLLASAGRDPLGTGTEVARCLPHLGSQSYFGIWPRVGWLWQWGSRRPQRTDPLYWGREGTATPGLPSWQLCPTGCAPIPNAGTAGYKGDSLQLPLSRSHCEHRLGTG